VTSRRLVRALGVRQLPVGPQRHRGIVLSQQTNPNRITVTGSDGVTPVPAVAYLGDTPPVVGSIVTLWRQGPGWLAMGYPQSGQFYPILGLSGTAGHYNNVPIFILASGLFSGAFGYYGGLAQQTMAVDAPRGQAWLFDTLSQAFIEQFTFADPGGAPNYGWFDTSTNNVVVTSAELSQTAYDPATQMIYLAYQPQTSPASTFTVLAIDGTTLATVGSAATSDTAFQAVLFDQGRAVLWAFTSGGIWVKLDRSTLAFISDFTPSYGASPGTALDCSWDPVTGQLWALFSGVSGTNLGSAYVIDPDTGSTIQAIPWLPHPSSATGTVPATVVCDPPRRRAYVHGYWQLADQINAVVVAYDLDTFAQLGTMALLQSDGFAGRGSGGKIGLDPGSGALGILGTETVGGVVVPCLYVVDGPSLTQRSVTPLPVGVETDAMFGVAPYGPGMDGTVY